MATPPFTTQVPEDAPFEGPPEVAARAALLQEAFGALLQGLLHGLIGSGWVLDEGARQSTQPGLLAKEDFQLGGIG